MSDSTQRGRANAGAGRTLQAAEMAEAEAERLEGAGVAREGCLEGGVSSPSLCQPTQRSHQ